MHFTMLRFYKFTRLSTFEGRTCPKDLESELELLQIAQGIFRCAPYQNDFSRVNRIHIFLWAQG